MSALNESLPYRRCVGAMVLNEYGDVFVGKRADSGDSPYVWQMPQGGIDKGESPLDAAKRELEEESGIHSVVLIGECDEWLSYDLPDEALGRWKGKYRGQTQKWYVFRFVGDEAEINLSHHEPPEFSEWKWVPIRDIPELIVPFKRQVYEALVSSFCSRSAK